MGHGQKMDARNRLKAAFVRACWSSQMSMAHSGTVLSMLDGLEGVTQVFVLSGFGFD